MSSENREELTAREEDGYLLTLLLPEIVEELNVLIPAILYVDEGSDYGSEAKD